MTLSNSQIARRLVEKDLQKKRNRLRVVVRSLTSGTYLSPLTREVRTKERDNLEHDIAMLERRLSHEFSTVEKGIQANPTAARPLIHRQIKEITARQETLNEYLHRGSVRKTFSEDALQKFQNEFDDNKRLLEELEQDRKAAKAISESLER